VLAESVLRPFIWASMLPNDAFSAAFELSDALAPVACTFVPALVVPVTDVPVLAPDTWGVELGVCMLVLVVAEPWLLQPAATKNTAAARKKIFFIG
jgi:hypothetical protein